MTYIKVLLKVCRVQHYLIRKSHAAFNPPSPTPHLCFDPICRTLWGPLALDELWVLCSRVCLLMFLGAQALSRSFVVGGFFLSHSPNPRTSLVVQLRAGACKPQVVMGLAIYHFLWWGWEVIHLSLVASSFDDLLADWIYSYPEETELCCFFRFCLAMILAGLCCVEGAKAWRGSCPCVLLISSVLNFPDCWTFSHYQMKLGKQPFAGVTSIAQTNSTHISFYNYLWRLGWLTVHCQVMDTGFKRNTV